MRQRLIDQEVLVGAERDPHGRVARDEQGNPRVYPGAVRDIEAFCRRILDNALDHWDMYITDEEYDEAVQELVEQALKLERKYDPQRSPSFAGYAHHILARRVVDAGPRRILGRSGGRIAERSHEELDERTTEAARPWQTLTTVESDPASDWGTNELRIQGNRDRLATWSHAILGL